MVVLEAPGSYQLLAGEKTRAREQVNSKYVGQSSALGSDNSRCCQANNSDNGKFNTLYYSKLSSAN